MRAEVTIADTTRCPSTDSRISGVTMRNPHDRACSRFRRIEPPTTLSRHPRWGL